MQKSDKVEKVKKVDHTHSASVQRVTHRFGCLVPNNVVGIDSQTKQMNKPFILVNIQHCDERLPVN